MKEIFDNVSYTCSQKVTNAYSTSFSLATKMLAPTIRQDIYNIYGFVRFADEIVDTFHGYPKAALLERFPQDTYRAIEERISLNPILNSFQVLSLFLYQSSLSSHQPTANTIKNVQECFL